MSPLRYASCAVFLALTALGIARGGLLAWASPLLAFGLVPLLELVLPASGANLDAAGEARVRGRRVYDWLIYAMVPAQWALLLYFFYAVSAGSLGGWQLLGVLVSVAMCCGAFGINVGHELGHRGTAAEQRLAVAALMSSLYAHFFVEHNRGHHARVATPADPASARRGEGLYRFWLRSVLGGLRSAWALERDRLARRGLGPWRWENLVLRHQLIQWGLVGGVLAAFGPAAAGLFLLAAAGGALLLETVNYVEHYGLSRALGEGGRYERVRPAHSWNSSHPLGRVLLFELTRHSDHHANPGRRYPLLRHVAEAPQLPTGYPGMILLALLPPLFFRVMDPQVARYSAG